VAYPHYASDRATLVAATQLVNQAKASGIAAFVRRKSNGLSFSWRHHTYSAADFLEIARLMDAGNILVGSVPGKASLTATYFQQIDFLALAPDIQIPPQNLIAEAAVLHELVHAINDLRGRPFQKLEDEKAAWLFWCYYARAYGFDVSRVPRGTNTAFLAVTFDFYDKSSGRAPAAAVKSAERAFVAALIALPEYRNIQREASMIDGIVRAYSR
jgi:hypothetical protein